MPDESRASDVCRNTRKEQADDLFVERIDFYEKNPPGAAWDGVFVAETK